MPSLKDVRFHLWPTLTASRAWTLWSRGGSRSSSRRICLSSSTASPGSMSKTVPRPPHWLLQPAWLHTSDGDRSVCMVEGAECSLAGSDLLKCLSSSVLQALLLQKAATASRPAFLMLPGLQRLQSQCLRQVLDALDDLSRTWAQLQESARMAQRLFKRSCPHLLTPGEHRLHSKGTDTGGLLRAPCCPGACCWSARFKWLSQRATSVPKLSASWSCKAGGSRAVRRG